jgi:hypothetical protein
MSNARSVREPRAFGPGQHLFGLDGSVSSETVHVKNLDHER